VNILDFSEDLYGKTLSVELIEYVRTEKTFADIKALQSQLVKDKETIRKILSE
jgi:riboflavin kinase/FMN adenylyltransferase